MLAAESGCTAPRLLMSVARLGGLLLIQRTEGEAAMSYKCENLPSDVLEQPSEPKTKPLASDQPSISKQLVAGTMSWVLTLASLPHAVYCATRNEPGSLFCGPKASMRRDLHIETTANSSSTSSSIQVITLLPVTGPPSLGGMLDWLDRPRI